MAEFRESIESFSPIINRAVAAGLSNRSICQLPIKWSAPPEEVGPPKLSSGEG
jgi:hypothetical protein